MPLYRSILKLCTTQAYEKLVFAFSLNPTCETTSLLSLLLKNYDDEIQYPECKSADQYIDISSYLSIPLISDLYAANSLLK